MLPEIDSYQFCCGKCMESRLFTLDLHVCGQLFSRGHCIVNYYYSRIMAWRTSSLRFYTLHKKGRTSVALWKPRVALSDAGSTFKITCFPWSSFERDWIFPFHQAELEFWVEVEHQFIAGSPRQGSIFLDTIPSVQNSLMVADSAPELGVFLFVKILTSLLKHYYLNHVRLRY